MKVVIFKRGKFMVGHGYATGIGYSFSWSCDPLKARIFAPGDPTAKNLANLAGATVRELAS